MSELKPPALARIEFTTLDPKLFVALARPPHKEGGAWSFCTRYEDAVSAPFPCEGKKGISVWAGPLAALKEPKARLLWELERRRGRPTLLVVTSQKGRSFMRSYREVASLLADPGLVPWSFLRRSGQGWDSLDFLSSGDSDFMKGANPRLKRLKQAGWESVVDRLAMIDPQLKAEYFETLELRREVVSRACLQAFHQLKLSPMVGIAGEGLSAESLYDLLCEPLLASLMAASPGLERPPEGRWLLLSHRQAGAELLFFGHRTTPLRVGQILSGSQQERAELAVAEVKQHLVGPEGSSEDHFCWVRVDWRYPPGREIPTLWQEKSVLVAGAEGTHS